MKEFARVRIINDGNQLDKFPLMIGKDETSSIDSYLVHLLRDILKEVQRKFELSKFGILRCPRSTRQQKYLLN